MLHDIMSVCIIMHNMIIEDEFDVHGRIVDLNVMYVPKVDMIVDKTKQFQWLFVLEIEMIVDKAEQFQWFLAPNKQIKDKEVHYALRNYIFIHKKLYH